MDNKICVIIPVKGEGLKIAECLNSIFELDYSVFEIIVVDDGLQDNGLAAINSFNDQIKILKSDSRGPSYARNLAARQTDARFVAFTDGDCIVDKSWLKELMRGFSKFPDAVACGGRQLLPQDAEEFEKKVYLFMKKVGFITDYMNKREDDIIEVNHNPSCNVIYKKDVFLREGGFLEGLWPGEDVELDYRLRRKGYKMLFNPRAIVYHYKPKNMADFSRMMYRYGEAQGMLVRKYGLFRKIHFIPAFSILFFIVGY
ncbi:MAG: glycosyltransferase, partial [Candidatus Omnitrophica bacterium]|nr:glycosyltransferase [Candidatus Omnitrophota bacterium]